MNFSITVYDESQKPSFNLKQKMVSFLHTHLEQFRDPIEDIEQAIAYALKEIPSFGGFILSGSIENQLVCVVVVNQTGMKNYIPENILVYIATHHAHRGKGIGKQMMQQALKLTEGDVALHVEPDNPARYLYHKLGFTNKYLEMRFIKS